MTTTSLRPRERHTDAVGPDRGCFVSARCVECPLNRCVLEVPAAELTAFRAAWGVLARYVAEPDRILEP